MQSPVFSPPPLTPTLVTLPRANLSTSPNSGNMAQPAHPFHFHGRLCHALVVTGSRFLADPGWRGTRGQKKNDVSASC